MINRLVEQKQAIQLYLTRHNKRNFDLTNSEWKLIAEFEAILKPFNEVTKMMCQDSSPISVQYPFAKMIHSKLSGTEFTASLIAVKDKMVELLEQKFFGLESER